MMNHDFHYLPVEPNGKASVMFDFPNKASRSIEDAKRWLSEGKNLGISTTKYNGVEALVVVDVDMKKGKNGDLEIKKRELLGDEFPETYTQYTPTGGRHLVYRAPKPVKNGTNVLGQGIDIRSKGGYIVASGSTIDGKSYTDNGKPVAECPQWLIDACGEAREKEESKPEDLSLIRIATAVKRATEFLITAPAAVDGAGGDEATFKVAARVKDFGVGSEDCLRLMLENWNDRCSPPWSPSELKSKVVNAYNYGARPIGADAPEVVFAGVSPINDKIKIPLITHEEWLSEMNATHALLFLNTGHTVLQQTSGPDGLPMTKYLPEMSFKRLYSNKLAPQTGKSRRRSQAEEWLDWEHRREYQGLCFSPEKPARPGFFNLWRGFVTEPVAYELASKEARAGFDMFIEHAKKNVTNGDEALFTWLMGYFAHMIQKPFERPLTTLVFKGRKGTGKNSLIDPVGNLLGVGHYLVAHNARYLTGQFNAHMEACLCLVLDEAFWSGDKSSEGQLKGLTTAPKILVEKKNMEPHQVDNLVRLIVLGNEEWLVPASVDERRYAVFTIGESRMQDTEFFTAMKENIEVNGGNAVLLHYLKNFDLSKVNTNVAPKTTGLEEQKQASLNPFEEWWFDSLVEGAISNSGLGSEWLDEIQTSTVREAFSRYLKGRNVRSRMHSDTTFGKEIRKVCPLITKADKRTDEGKTKVYRFPTLEQARDAWDKFIGHKTKWNEEV